MGKRKAAGSIVLNAMTIVITLLIIISSLYFVRDKMLKNAQSLGTALTQSYATEQSAAGIGSSDISLAAIARCSGPEAVPVAIAHGILINISMPFFVSFFCKL